MNITIIQAMWLNSINMELMRTLIRRKCDVINKFIYFKIVYQYALVVAVNLNPDC